jgi:hypothetical protein
MNGHTATAIALIEEGADVNATDQHGFTPLRLAISENKQDTALAISHYGKIPYASVPSIEGNPASKYIQHQYQLANKQFTELNPSPKDTIMARINILTKCTGDKYIYLNMITLLCKKKLPQEMVKMIMGYSGLNFNNLNLNVLKSSDLLPAEATTHISHSEQEGIKINTPMLGA